MAHSTGKGRSLMGRAPLALGLAVIAALTLGGPGSSTARISPGRTQKETAEVMLQKAVAEMGSKKFDATLGEIDSLIRAQPNFRLAHLVRGDLLMARVRPLEKIGAGARAPVQRLSDLRDEAAARLRAARERPPQGRIPKYLLQMPSEARYAIVVDTSRSRLYLYRNDGGLPRLAGDYYVSSGKAGAVKTREGDQKTPIGVYHVVSSLPRQKLLDLYGAGAFPINYPNEWDRRMGRNGYGIWLHGTPSDTYSRPPRASDGCVVLTNADLEALAPNFQVGLTPVIISENVDWISDEEWRSDRKEFIDAFERWRLDWESRDTERYLSHYSHRFATKKEDLAQWRRSKQRVNVSRAWIKVGVSDLSVFRDPGSENMMVVEFQQDYRSSALANVMKKRQYWLREGGRWRIVYEGAA
ncbi:MAG: L,D-transpeptidase family protein [Burkholderiales bacterium]|nr:L,D-transpeptidase family protein [Burkholderiales bacterium]